MNKLKKSKNQISFIEFQKSDIDLLREKYLELVNIDLPARSKKYHWSIKSNHCFGRIILDNVFGMCWYDAIGKSSKPAYLRLTISQLHEAITIAESLHETISDLNTKSLTWRNKKSR